MKISLVILWHNPIAGLIHPPEMLPERFIAVKSDKIIRKVDKVSLVTNF